MFRTLLLDILLEDNILYIGISLGLNNLADMSLETLLEAAEFIDCERDNDGGTRGKLHMEYIVLMRSPGLLYLINYPVCHHSW